MAQDGGGTRVFVYLEAVKSLLRSSFIAAAACAFAAGGPSHTARAQSETPTPEAILQKMAAAYAEVNSYSDSSVANYRNPDGSERLTVQFRIWFARPAHFRIDARSMVPGGKAPRREVMWTDGTVARSWATDKPVSSRAKVQIAGSGMFGTYAYHIPTMLESSYGGEKRVHNLDAPKLTGEENFEGVDCYRVAGDWQGGAYELWIAKTDHLLRKLVAKYRDHEMEEIHREIAINPAISLEVFRFAPETDAAPAPKKK